MKPIPGLRCTLISESTLTPYSGMLPGLVAGVYSHEEAHIDLRRLCQAAGVNFLLAEATALDCRAQQLSLGSLPDFSYDYLSLNVGSTPELSSISGDNPELIPVKPVVNFLKTWEPLAAGKEARKLLVIGAGAGGVELGLSMSLRRPDFEIHLLQRGSEVLANHNPAVRQLALAALKRAQVKIHFAEREYEVNRKQLKLSSGESFNFDAIFAVTYASANKMFTDSGLKLDSKGFVLVNEHLQSLSHANVFAAGDIASFETSPRSKSGVFAVRAAKPLGENIRRSLAGKNLVAFKPQKSFLSLIGSGKGRAIASRGDIALEGRWLWRLKEFIDRRFMRRFEELPLMQQEEPSTALEAEAQMRCLGCASKVPAEQLSRVLSRLREDFPAELFAAENDFDDAVSVEVPAGLKLLQTTDLISAFIDDDYRFGRIATLHALSDIFAMGAKPSSALIQTLLPFSAPEVSERRLYSLLSGVLSAMKESDMKLLGGHSAEAPQVMLGLTVNGFCDGEPLRNRGAKEGDLLVLSKSLGTGVLMAAHMRFQAKGADVEAALEQMLTSNAEAAELLIKHGASACTDVTGFGLLGHLSEVLEGSKLRATIDLEALPVLPGALQLLRKGIRSSLYESNRLKSEIISNAEEFSEAESFKLLFDPQTSGGLLAALAPQNFETLQAESTGFHLVGRIDSAASAEIVLS